MPGDSPEIYQSSWLLLRSSGAVFAVHPRALFIRLDGPFIVRGVTTMAILSLVLPWLR